MTSGVGRFSAVIKPLDSLKSFTDLIVGVLAGTQLSHELVTSS